MKQEGLDKDIEKAILIGVAIGVILLLLISYALNG